MGAAALRRHRLNDDVTRGGRGADLLPDTSAASSADLGPALALAAFPHGLEIARSYLAMDPARRHSFLGVVRAPTAELGPAEALAAAE